MTNIWLNIKLKAFNIEMKTPIHNTNHVLYKILNTS